MIKCKTRSTWGIYLNGVKIMLTSPLRTSWLLGLLKRNMSSNVAGIIGGFLWATIGFLLILGQVSFDVPAIITIPFPFNLLLAIVGLFVIAPLGFIHMFKKLGEEVERRDC